MMVLVVLLAGLLFPGFGQAVAGRTAWAIAWAIAVPLLHGLAVVVSPWCFFASFGARIVGAFHGGWSLGGSAKLDWFSPLPLAIPVFAIGAFAVLRVSVVQGFAVPTNSMVPTLDVSDRVFATNRGDVDRGDIVFFHNPCNPQEEFVKRIIARGGDTVEVRCALVYVNGTAIAASPVPGPCTWRNVPCSEYREDYRGHHYSVYGDPERAARTAHGEADRRDFPRLDLNLAPSCSSRSVEPDAGAIVDVMPTAPSACAQQRHYLVPQGAFFMMGDNRLVSNDSRVWGAVPKDAIIGRAVSIWLASGPDGYDWSRVRMLR
jgi:signal peptidase I